MNLLNISPFAQYVVRGLILLAAVIFDRYKQKRSVLFDDFNPNFFSLALAHRQPLPGWRLFFQMASMVTLSILISVIHHIYGAIRAAYRP